MEILQYLWDIGQDFRTDETNADTRWTRNRLRHELLPMLRERYNPSVDDALLRLAAQAGEAQQLIAGFAQQIADAVRVAGSGSRRRLEHRGRPRPDRLPSTCQFSAASRP